MTWVANHNACIHVISFVTVSLFAELLTCSCDINFNSWNHLGCELVSTGPPPEPVALSSDEICLAIATSWPSSVTGCSTHLQGSEASPVGYMWTFFTGGGSGPRNVQASAARTMSLQVIWRYSSAGNFRQNPPISRKKPWQRDIFSSIVRRKTALFLQALRNPINVTKAKLSGANTLTKAGTTLLLPSWARFDSCQSPVYGGTGRCMAVQTQRKMVTRQLETMSLVPRPQVADLQPWTKSVRFCIVGKHHPRHAVPKPKAETRDNRQIAVENLFSYERINS